MGCGTSTKRGKQPIVPADAAKKSKGSCGVPSTLTTTRVLLDEAKRAIKNEWPETDSAALPGAEAEQLRSEAELCRQEAAQQTQSATQGYRDKRHVHAAAVLAVEKPTPVRASSVASAPSISPHARQSPLQRGDALPQRA